MLLIKKLKRLFFRKVQFFQSTKSSAPTSAAQQSSGKLVIRMLAFLKPVRWIALITGSIILLRVACEIASVYFLSPAVTTVSTFIAADKSQSFLSWWQSSNPEILLLKNTLFWMVISQISLGVMIYLRSVWDCKLSMNAVYHIRASIYDRLQSTAFSFHDKMTTGQLINRALSDLQSVRSFVNMSLITTLDIVFSISGYFCLLFFRSPWLALAALAPLPLWIFIILRFSKKAQPIYSSQQEATDQMMTALTENVAGVHVVKAFGTNEREITRYTNLNSTLLNRLFAMIHLQQRLTPMLKLIAISAHVGLFVLTAYLIQLGKMTVGDLMILGIAMGTILSKLQQINMIAETYQKAIVSSRRLFEILDMPHNNEEKLGTKPLKHTSDAIELQNVQFGYHPKRPVLQNINVVIPEGRITALVGPMGAGKTTLAALITRFYDPQVGRILISAQDIAHVSLKELRRAVGFVFQETFLFSDTIRNNIRYGRMDVSEEMIYKAAKITRADEFIRKLPQGYDTLLGERGVMLSGGQKQRLALARALVYDPRILILDDATAALDPETDAAVHASLPSALNGRTVLIIAHRLSTLRRADHLIVMENGKIIETGTHAELMAQDGHYREIVRAQIEMPEPSSQPKAACKILYSVKPATINGQRRLKPSIKNSRPLKSIG